jgi:hypothetical protein
LLHLRPGQGVLIMKRRKNTDLPHLGQPIMKLPTLPIINQASANGKTAIIAAPDEKPIVVTMIGTPHIITGIARIMASMKRRPR